MILYIFIILATIFIASRADLMYENITGVAAIPQYRSIVIGFTIMCALFYTIKMTKIFRHDNFSKIYQLIIIITGITMSIGAFFPYTSGGKDIASKIHVYCSMLSCLSFLILLWIYTRQLSYINPALYLKIHSFYDLGLQFLAILFIVFTRVNGYLEILFACLVSLYLMMIEKNDG